MQSILAIDQGTTGTRAILYSDTLAQRFDSYREHTQYSVRPGWCEHDAQEIYRNTCAVTADVLAQARAAGIRPGEIRCAGIANQGETVLAWSRKTGEPLCRAIVWHCQRTADMVEELRQDTALCDYVRSTTGLMVHSYFSATKYCWLMEHVPAVRQAMREDDLCLGTLDSWLIYRFTNGARFVTDCATASRTMLCSLATLDWDDRLLARFGLSRAMLAEILPNCADFGALTLPEEPGLSIPITGSIVDQQGALLGQCCFERGTIKATYGTGCFLLLNTGEKPVIPEIGLLATVAWKVGAQVQYALDGGVHFAGAAVQWLKNSMRFIRDYGELDAKALALKGNDDVYFVPAFAGLAAPYWDSSARGMLIGLTMGSTPEHVVRATLESIAFQIRDLLDLIERSASLEIKGIQADGGISRSRFLMQMQADMLQRPVCVMNDCEATARGVAMLAGLAVGIWPDMEALRGLPRKTERFDPAMPRAEADRLMASWHAAVKRAMHWTDRETP